VKQLSAPCCDTW